MINWFDMPTQGLSNGGEFEIKELTATENKVYQKDGEVYNKVTVNVEGGGGGGDFSTAEVTFVEDSTSAEGSSEPEGLVAIITDRQGNELIGWLDTLSPDGETATMVLYKGHSYGYLSSVTSVSGDVINDSGDLDITGDCTIHYIGIDNI